MMKLQHKFVSYIPDKIEDGIIYISFDFNTVIHKCCCGCGNEVVTPLSPAQWSLTFNGKNISLSPSIGNWKFDCESHYWIKNNEVQWAEKWSKEEIAESDINDKEDLANYYLNDQENTQKIDGGSTKNITDTELNIWQKVKKWFSKF